MKRMMECERIIKKGIVDSTFLEEEIRCDYIVSSKMKKVWAIELDLLARFSEICIKHKLTFWVGFGTLLGTIRHKGFIPWDDDMDVWMPREDYNKLISLKLNLEEPYFFQTTLNDDDYYSSFARLRNSNTTGILVSKNNKCNNGIYIDIYPLDAADKNEFVQWVVSKYIKVYNVFAHAYAFNINPSPIAKIIHWWLKRPYIKYDLRKTYKKVDRLAQRNCWKDANKVGLIVFNPYKHKKNFYRKKSFLDTEMMDFEGLKVPVPSGYEDILTILYGDYMKFPPIEKRGTWHQFVFEPDIPYKEYMLTEKMGGY